MEEKQKKIGLCLAFKGTSYGALLQSFATQYIIEKQGYYTEIIDYTNGKRRKYHFSPEAFIYLVMQKIFRKLKSTSHNEVLDENHQSNIQGRIAVSEDFRKNKLKNIIKLYGYEALRKHAEEYYAVIIGSDQMWSPEVSFSNFLSLRFVPNGVKRISYATSTGVSEYPWYVKRQARQFLTKIDYLSVREQAGYNIIKEITGREAKIVADPTYLLTQDEWKMLIPEKEIVKSGYIFAFFLGDNPRMKKLARDYADRQKLRIVSILSNEVNVDDSWYADEILTSCSPDDFINLIRHSECVITDSFHGLAFSVINEKEVYVSHRVIKSVKSRNQRIDDIVRKFGIEDRLILDPETFSFEKEKIDYHEVNLRLEAYRKKSLSFLQDALS